MFSSISSQIKGYGQKYTKAKKTNSINNSNQKEVNSSKKIVNSSKKIVNSSKKIVNSSKKIVNSSKKIVNSSKLTSINRDEAKKFADRMAEASQKYVFLQKQESASQDILTFRYASSSITKTKSILNKNCKECMDVQFKKNTAGEADYTFSHVWGDFSDLFLVWKTLFSPNAKKSDYEISDQNVLVQWTVFYGGQQVFFGRIGTAWFIKI